MAKCEIEAQVKHFVHHYLDLGACEFWYFASPYSADDPATEQERVAAIDTIILRILAEYPNVFPLTPVSYTARYDETLKLPPIEFYKKDLIALKKADRLIVCLLPGWEDSVGVQMEIRYAKQWGIPICYYHTTGEKAGKILNFSKSIESIEVTDGTETDQKPMER